MNIYKIRAWIRHRIKAKNAYSIHSPYMFELYNSIIKNKSYSRSRLIKSFEARFGKEGIIYIDRDNFEGFSELENKIYIYIDQYKDESSHRYFEYLISLAEDRVSIDLFYIGVFIRNKN